ncbi:glucose-6-phosphate isomerase [Magnetococcales bacterium HHB-1]
MSIKAIGDLSCAFNTFGPTETAALSSHLGSRLKHLQEEISTLENHQIPFLSLLDHDQEIKKAKLWAKRIQQRAKRLIIFGIGGSSLGADMLVHHLGNQAIKIQFFDNVDPETLARLQTIPWEESFVLAISKSGGTAETLSQLLTTLPILQRVWGENLNEHMAVITENRTGALFTIAQHYQLPIIEHPAVGGRFSVLSVVGLLPAMVAGVDIDALLKGARHMAQACKSHQFAENPALLFSAIQTVMFEQGRNISIMMSYGDSLSKISAWYAQLWSESLGKKEIRQKRAKGLTPVASRGVTDQHSQLQLYMDGPDDKQFTLLFNPTLASQGETIPAQFASLESVKPLANRTTGALFEAEFLGTRDSLIHGGKPVRVFHLPSNDAKALGSFLLLMELETLFTARLMQIDPFDQPAVEDSKVRARRYLMQGV